MVNVTDTPRNIFIIRSFYFLDDRVAEEAPHSGTSLILIPAYMRSLFIVSSGRLLLSFGY